MRAPCDATLLRIFIGYDDVFDDRPLHEQIVLKAREMGLAGATVTRGILAYGPASQELQIRLRLSEDLPIVIEIIDIDEKIKEFVPTIAAMIDSGLVTTQSVSVLCYGRKSAST